MTASPTEIDLNCDLGEGIAEDKRIIPLVSSCSLACGGHAGDPETLRSLLLLSKAHGTRAGAHPSYPDRQHFGRRSMQMTSGDFEQAIGLQLETFLQACRDTGVLMHHIKAHGALYNDMSWDPERIELYLKVLRPYRESSKLYAPCGSPLVSRARKSGFLVVEEGFADRAYLENGRLVPRTTEGAVITSPEEVWQRVREIVLRHRVPLQGGGFWSMHPSTLCIHGDTSNVFEILTYLRKQMSENNIRLPS